MRVKTYLAINPWLCLFCGAALPLSLAPFNFWAVAPLAIACFIKTIYQAPAQKTFLYGWLFGIGMFASGTSWVYISIHDYGYAPIPLAVFLTGIFVIGLAFVFALPFYLYGKYFNQIPLHILLAFPALWVLGEWLRSWLLTGFPWLYVGYGYVDTPLAGWFPLVGVYGVSWIVVFISATLIYTFIHAQKNQKNYKQNYGLIITAIILLNAYGLQKTQWTSIDNTQPITIGVVQPNFTLQDKWDRNKQPYIRKTLTDMSTPLWESNDIVLWPEAALTELYHEAFEFFQGMDEIANHSNTTLITGIPSLQDHHYYNSIVAMGEGTGLYNKVRLVPFGEYVPLEKWLRGLIRFFDLPASYFSKGEEQQEPLSINNHRGQHYVVASFICYEIVYPDLVAKNSEGADFLITISNDSWFGDSIGPLQHLQMAQVRAREAGRYVVRATNDGISAIINPQGKILKKSERFKQQTLSGVIYPAEGSTLFMRTGSLPLMTFLSLLLMGLYQNQKRKRHPTKQAI